MSTFVEIVAKTVADISGLVEVRKSWGGELFSVDPPQYEFGALRFKDVPVVPHVRSLLASSLPGEHHCLELDYEVVMQWASRRLDPGAERDLRELFSRLSLKGEAWSVVLDTSSDDSCSISSCAPEDAFSCIDDAIRNKSGLIGFVIS